MTHEIIFPIEKTTPLPGRCVLFSIGILNREWFFCANHENLVSRRVAFRCELTKSVMSVAVCESGRLPVCARSRLLLRRPRRTSTQNALGGSTSGKRSAYSRSIRSRRGILTTLSALNEFLVQITSKRGSFLDSWKEVHASKFKSHA